MQTQELTMTLEPVVNPALVLGVDRDGTNGLTTDARGANRQTAAPSLWAYTQTTVAGDRWENRVWLALAAMAALELALVWFRA